MPLTGQAKTDYQREYMRSQRANNRSNGSCVDCDYSETPATLVKHHIDGNRANNSPENKVKLCPNCHAKRHISNGRVLFGVRPAPVRPESVRPVTPAHVRPVTTSLRDDIEEAKASMTSAELYKAQYETEPVNQLARPANISDDQWAYIQFKAEQDTGQAAHKTAQGMVQAMSMPSKRMFELS